MCPRPAGWTLFSAVVVFLGACDSPVTNDTATPISLLVVSGSGQTGAVGAELPAPLVVRVTRLAGKAIVGVPNQRVNFRVVTGGGSVFAGSALTDPQGMAQEYWTLGLAAGANVLEVRAVDPSTGEKLVFARFTATAVVPGPEVCNGVDDNFDGTVDDPTWRYCVAGHAAPNTDGMNSCTGGYSDLDAMVANGCERLVAGTWTNTPTVTLECPSIPLGFGDVSISQVRLAVASPTELLAFPRLNVLGFFTVEPGSISIPIVPLSENFSGSGPIQFPETPILALSGGSISGSGTVSVSGAFTGPSSLQATLQLTLALSGEVHVVPGFDIDLSGSCTPLDVAVTATRTGP
jgi:hypothetical protein